MAAEVGAGVVAGGPASGGRAPESGLELEVGGGAEESWLFSLSVSCNGRRLPGEAGDGCLVSTSGFTGWRGGGSLGIGK